MPARLRVAAFLAALVFPAFSSGAEVAPAPKAVIDPADALAARIDAHLTKDWAARGLIPAELTDDAEFVRRVYLDLIGRAPKASEARAFIDEKAADKRAKLVEYLLKMPGHANYFAAVTRAQWLPQTTTNFQLFAVRLAVRDVAADRVPRQHSRRSDGAANPHGRDHRQHAEPRLPVRAGDRRRPGRTAHRRLLLRERGQGRRTSARPSSRLFLGVKLECAQCHDHPFAPYTRDQFWQFAAFFAEMNPLTGSRPGFVGPIQPQSDRNRISVMGTDRKVTATFFDGTNPDWSLDTTPRQELANWLVGREEPVLREEHGEPDVGALLRHRHSRSRSTNRARTTRRATRNCSRRLGTAFADSGFDNRMLIRAITRSKAYQLTSKMTHPGQADPRRFARMSLKGLTPAQLFDSMVAATGFREPAYMRNQQNFGFAQPNNPRSQFLTRFANTERATETNTTILQALMLMNGQFIGDQTDLAKSELLAAIVDMPGWDTKQRVGNLFLTAFARNPTPEELEKFTSYVDRGGATNDKKQALADVFWVLLNSPEFLFNH